MYIASRGLRGAVILVIAAAVAGPSVPATFEDVLAGQLVLLLAEDFVGPAAAEFHAVQTPDGRVVEADVSRVRNVDRLVGQPVRLVGDDLGSVFVASRDMGSEETSVMATAASDVRRTAIVMFNFSNDSTKPWTADFVNGTVFTGTGSVAAYYEEVSYGSTTFAGDVFGWVTIPYQSTDCRYSDWASAAQTAAGVDTSKYQHIVYAFPRTSACTWAGLSTVGGRFAWVNGAMTLRTVGHELAHMLGVHHASALNCTKDGARVPYSDSCSRVEYGDPFSIMGLGTRHHHNWQRAQMGWIPEMVTVTSSGSYGVAPVEKTDQPRIVRVPRGNGTYLYLEFRQPFGTFETITSSSAVASGVTIRVAPDKSSRVQSMLLDMTPSTSTFEDAALAVGRSFIDPVSGITVTTTATSSSSATVSLRFPGSGSSSAPVQTSTPTPTPTRTPTPTPTRTPTPTPTPTRTPSPTAPVSASPSPAPTTPSPSPSPAATPSAIPTQSSPPAPTPTPTATPGSESPVPVTQLTAPTWMKAVRLRAPTVRVRWGASSGTVAYYRILRNGVRIGRSSGLRFYDRVPAGFTKLTYVVRAVDRNGKVGPRSRAFTVYLNR